MSQNKPSYNELLQEVARLKECLSAAQRYRSIFEKAGDAMALIDPNGCFLEVNREFCRRLGYSREEFFTMTPEGITSEKFRGSVNPRIKLLLDQGSIVAESEHIAKDGTVIPVELDSRTVVIDNRKVILTVARDISRRKELEQCRIVEQDRFISVLEAIPEGVYIVNHHFEIEFINPSIEKEFGPVTGRKCFAYMHNRLTPCPDCKIKEVFNGQTVRRFWHSSISNRDYEITDSPLTSVDDMPAKVAFFRDITEEQRAKSSLVKNRALLASIINNSSTVIYLKDVNGRYLMVNKRFKELMARDGREVIGLTDFDLFPSEEAATLRKNDQQALARKQVQQFEETLCHGDGEHVYISTKFTIIDSDGSLIGVAGISTDITERKQLEMACLQTREKLRTLINASPDIICFKDGTGKILLANEAFRKMFRLEEKDYINKTNSELAEQHPDFAEIFMRCEETDEDCWQRNELKRSEEILLDQDEREYIFEVIKVPLFNQDGSREGLVVQAHDITELRQAERRLLKEIKARRMAAEILQEKTRELDEANVALRVLVRQQENGVAEHQQQILAVLKKAVFPYLDILEQDMADERGKEYVNAIRTHLSNLGDNFIKKLDSPDLGLTNKEILVADLVRQGKSTRAIAELFGLRPRSIEAYRNSIRKKLKLTQKKISLAQYLRTRFSSMN